MSLEDQSTACSWLFLFQDDEAFKPETLRMLLHSVRGPMEEDHYVIKSVFLYTQVITSFTAEHTCRHTLTVIINSTNPEADYFLNTFTEEQFLFR